MTQRGIYSELKPTWWLAREGELPEGPKQVQFILSDLCNQSCSFCAYRMDGYTSNELFMGASDPAKYGHNNPVRMVPTERALQLLDEFKSAGALGVQFTGGGEPTVHKHHEDIFEKTLHLGMRASLVSNGLKWSKRLRTEILPNFSWVRVSIDAGNRETYALIRKTNPMNWDHVWRNVEELAASIKKNKSQCVLGLGFVVTPYNWEEIPDFVRKAARSGADNVRLSAMFSGDGEKPFEDIYDKITVVIHDTQKSYSRENFSIHDNFGSRLSDLEQHSPDYEFCGYQHYTTYVGGDLQVYRCCVYSYNKRGLVEGGDLSKNRFDDFWASEGRTKDMVEFDARGCQRCQFNEKNRAINYLLQIDPPHKEFP